jgi:hypothetical protein
MQQWMQQTPSPLPNRLRRRSDHDKGVKTSGFETWCELSHKIKTERGALNVWGSPHSGYQRFRPDSVTSHESCQHHKHANTSLLLSTQQATKVAFNGSLLSKSEDLEVVNKFSIVFTMVQERISLRSFQNMCSGASLLAAVQTAQAHPPENGHHCLMFKQCKSIPRLVKTMLNSENNVE